MQILFLIDYFTDGIMDKYHATMPNNDYVSTQLLVHFWYAKAIHDPVTMFYRVYDKIEWLCIFRMFYLSINLIYLLV